MLINLIRITKSNTYLLRYLKSGDDFYGDAERGGIFLDKPTWERMRRRHSVKMLRDAGVKVLFFGDAECWHRITICRIPECPVGEDQDAHLSDFEAECLSEWGSRFDGGPGRAYAHEGYVDIDRPWGRYIIVRQSGGLDI